MTVIIPARSLPKISYMKALDIYLAFCFWMVFGALLEFATVSYTGKRIKLNQRRWEEFSRRVSELAREMRGRGGGGDLLPTTTTSTSAGQVKASAPTRLCGVRDSDIERLARVAFPIIFLTFHTIYWTTLFRCRHTTTLHLPDTLYSG